MKQNIEIEVPDGFEAKYNSETQKIEMVKKDNKPRSWKEYCDLKSIPDGSRCYANSISEHLCQTKEEAESFIALMKLRTLRKEWVGDWEANWEDPLVGKHIIYFWNEKIEITTNCFDRRSLSFPTKKMAEEFLNCFKDLIKKAKILL